MNSLPSTKALNNNPDTIVLGDQVYGYDSGKAPFNGVVTHIDSSNYITIKGFNANAKGYEIREFPPRSVYKARHVVVLSFHLGEYNFACENPLVLTGEWSEHNIPHIEEVIGNHLGYPVTLAKFGHTTIELKASHSGGSFCFEMDVHFLHTLNI